MYVAEHTGQGIFSSIPVIIECPGSAQVCFNQGVRLWR